MLLTCENCKTVFRIDEAQIINDHQRVRCSVCTHIWVIKSAHTPLPKTANAVYEAAIKLRFLALGLLIIMAFSTTLYYFRSPISARFPSLISSFETIGFTIKPDLKQLEIRDLEASYQNQLLRVRGQIVNHGQFISHAPFLQLEVSDDKGGLILSREFKPESRFIEATASAEFFIQIEILDIQQANIEVNMLDKMILADFFTLED